MVEEKVVVRESSAKVPAQSSNKKRGRKPSIKERRALEKAAKVKARREKRIAKYEVNAKDSKKDRDDAFSKITRSEGKRIQAAIDNKNLSNFLPGRSSAIADAAARELNYRDAQRRLDNAKK